jgi:hypothetical protein
LQRPFPFGLSPAAHRLAGYTLSTDVQSTSNDPLMHLLTGGCSLRRIKSATAIQVPETERLISIDRAI